MKRAAAIVAIGLAAVAIYAVTAPAGQQSVSPKAFAALSAKVTKLSKDVNTLKSCTLVGAIPVARFGDPTNATEGYLYVNADKTQQLVPAIDESTVAAAQGWVLLTTPACGQALGGGRHAVHLKAASALHAK
jgi:hypothetical protein